MDKEKPLLRVGSEALFPVVREMLLDGKLVRITVIGNSMFPFIRSHRDEVLLRKAAFDEIKKLDIIFIMRTSGEYVLHRVQKIAGNSVFIVGDAQRQIEGPIQGSQIIGKAETIYRGRAVIQCDAPQWRFAAFIWLLLRPFRIEIIHYASAIYGKIWG